MRNVPAIVSLLYAHQDAEKLAPFEKSLKKAMVDFYAENKAKGIEKFYKVVDNTLFFEELLAIVSATELKLMINEVDPAFYKSGISTAEMRSRILKRIIDQVPMTDDVTLRAKTQLPGLKACKNIEDLKNFHSICEETVFKAAIRLIPTKSLRPFAKRFDKHNLQLAEADESTLLRDLEGLASGRQEPLAKPKKAIPSAAARAKWSGKEPD